MGDQRILTGHRLPIKYELDTIKLGEINNPFLTRFGKIDSIENLLIDVFDNNLSFACYNLFKWKGEPLKLAPFQAVALQMMWEKTFPMVLMSRGAGKCTRNSIILTDKGLFDLNDKYINDKNLYGETGFRSPFSIYEKPPEQIIKITSSFGYTIEGTKDHPIRIIDCNGDLAWKELGKIDKSDILAISRDSNYEFNGNYKIDKDVSYVLGALIGDGCFSEHCRTNIGFTNADKDIVNEVKAHSAKLWQTAYFSELKSKDISFSINFRSRSNLHDCLNYYGIKQSLSVDKEIPLSILQANKDSLSAFLSGLFDTDGGMTSRGIEYSTVSKRLAKQVHISLLIFGIISKLRKRKIKYNGDFKTSFSLQICGDSAIEFRNKIGFRCKRKQDLLVKYCKKKFNPNRDLVKNTDNKILNLRDKAKSVGRLGRKFSTLVSPSKVSSYNYSYAKLNRILDETPEAILDSNEYQSLVKVNDLHLFHDSVKEIEILPDATTYDVAFHDNDHSFITNGFISHNSWLLGLYAILRAIMVPGTKVVIVAASFRQSKLVWEYARQIYDYSPIAQECITKVSPNNDMYYMAVNNGMSTIIALPLGDGERIRGIRATDILVDEFASVPEEVLNVVVRGFASVSSDPIRNAEVIHNEELLVKQGKLDPNNLRRRKGNKIIVSGTATYQFNHFFKSYQLYKNILDRRFSGDSSILNKEIGINEQSEETNNIDWRDYGLIQLPYMALPKGFMDDKQIAQAKASMPKAQFQMEYECQFPTDSDGFFKRSAIDASTPGSEMCREIPPFSIELKGEPGFDYVMGIDPARKSDNFAICILKILPDGRFKNVYAWSINNKSFIICVRKIRDLLRKFNVVRIALDAGGGGLSVEDLLQSAENAQPNDMPIWRYDEKEHRMLHGLHILDVVNFTSSWIAEANYGMAADIEHQRLLFPLRGIDKSLDIDELKEIDDVWDNINEQINETCMIVVTPTKTGVQHFDLPETNIPGVQNTQRKDRYSALLLASYAARTYSQEKTFNDVNIFPGDWLENL